MKQRYLKAWVIINGTVILFTLAIWSVNVYRFFGSERTKEKIRSLIDGTVNIKSIAFRGFIEFCHSPITYFFLLLLIFESYIMIRKKICLPRSWTLYFTVTLVLPIFYAVLIFAQDVLIKSLLINRAIAIVCDLVGIALIVSTLLVKTNFGVWQFLALGFIALSFYMLTEQFKKIVYYPYIKIV